MNFDCIKYIIKSNTAYPDFDILTKIIKTTDTAITKVTKVKKICASHI